MVNSSSASAGIDWATVVVTLAASLPAFRSGVVAATLAVFTTCVPAVMPAGTLKANRNDALEPFGSDAAVQVMTPAPPMGGVAQTNGVPLSWVAEAKVRFEGIMSVSATPAALPGPLFVTVIV